MASEKGHVPVVQALLQGGADVDKADNIGTTPLCMASWKVCLNLKMYSFGNIKTTVSTLLYDYSPAAVSGLVKMPDCSL
jgi:hypothetical protein